MKYWCPYLLVVALSVCRLTEGREGRVIFMNTDQSIDIALQVVVPFGVALPMVKKESRQGRRERIQDKILDHEHPVYGIRLAKLDYYFNHLEVDSEICRQKLLCELAENPEEFSPVSDIFFKQLELWIPEVGDGRYSQYVMAAQHGIMSAVNDTQTGSCEHHFPSCRSQVLVFPTPQQMGMRRITRDINVPLPKIMPHAKRCSFPQREKPVNAYLVCDVHPA